MLRAAQIRELELLHSRMPVGYHVGWSWEQSYKAGKHSTESLGNDSQRWLYLRGILKHGDTLNFFLLSLSSQDFSAWHWATGCNFILYRNKHIDKERQNLEREREIYTYSLNRIGIYLHHDFINFKKI